LQKVLFAHRTPQLLALGIMMGILGVIIVLSDIASAIVNWTYSPSVALFFWSSHS